MKAVPKSIARLVREFNKLPGIGSKTSERFVFFLLRQPKEDMEALAHSLLALKNSVRTCQECFTYMESTNGNERCDICTDPLREHTRVCVVAQAKDVISIEKTGEFNGLYHVLGGVINHTEGVGPEQLRVNELIIRLDNLPIEEVIIATNPTMEGETTALFVANQLKERPITVTKIARGLPMGGDIEFADELTLGSSIKARQHM